MALFLRRSLGMNQKESSSRFDSDLGSDEWGQGAALQSQHTEQVDEINQVLKPQTFSVS